MSEHVQTYFVFDWDEVFLLSFPSLEVDNVDQELLDLQWSRVWVLDIRIAGIHYFTWLTLVGFGSDSKTI